MDVCLEVLFEVPTADDEADLRAIALELTRDANSVRVFPREGDANWLVADFTMPNQPQYQAVERIDRTLRFWATDRLDSVIRFPMSNKERERVRRKAERRRAKRKEA